jgi:gas vesicle protein
MSSRKLVLGLMAGIAAGALLGMLFAPQKGSKTRKKILKRGEDYADILKDKLTAFLSGLSDKFEKVKEDVNGV